MIHVVHSVTRGATVSDTRGTLRDRGATVSDTRGTLCHRGSDRERYTWYTA